MMVRNNTKQETSIMHTRGESGRAVEAVAGAGQAANTYSCCLLVKHGIPLTHLALVERPQLVARHNNLAHVQL